MKLVKNVLLPDFKALTVQTGDVLIKDGRFAEVGGVINAPDAEVIEGSGMLMLPAMSDIHTHMVQSLTKGVLDDLNITDWLVRMLAVQSRLTDEDWYWGVLLGCLQSLRFGVTNVNEMTYFPHIDAVAQAYKDAAVQLGASPRASLALMRTAQSYAFLNGRAYVIPEDVLRMTPYVLPHRLRLTREARLQHMESRRCLPFLHVLPPAARSSMPDMRR